MGGLQLGGGCCGLQFKDGGKGFEIGVDGFCSTRVTPVWQPDATVSGLDSGTELPACVFFSV